MRALPVMVIAVVDDGHDSIGPVSTRITRPCQVARCAESPRSAPPGQVRRTRCLHWRTCALVPTPGVSGPGRRGVAGRVGAPGRQRLPLQFSMILTLKDSRKRTLAEQTKLLILGDSRCHCSAYDMARSGEIITVLGACNNKVSIFARLESGPAVVPHACGQPWSVAVNRGHS